MGEQKKSINELFFFNVSETCVFSPSVCFDLILLYFIVPCHRSNSFYKLLYSFLCLLHRLQLIIKLRWQLKPGNHCK